MDRENEEDKEMASINRQAAEWLSKRQKGFSGDDQDAFFDWLAKDERHSARYAAHSRVWKRLDLLAEWRTEHSETPNEDLLQVKAKKNSHWGAWLGGMAAALALGAFLLFEVETKTSDEPTNLVAKEFERHELPDGSFVDLNTGSALKIEYTRTQRRIELVASEAYFEVAKDHNRPFIVSAKGVEVTAVGTIFNVRIVDQQVEVLVTEGRVRLNQVNKSAILSDSLETTGQKVTQQDLAAGQFSIISTAPSNSPILVKAATPEDIRRIEEWRKTLDFDSVPLGEVIAEFNRRNDIKLVLEDEDLSSQPIVASFHSDDSEQFIELLELMIDIDVTRENDRIIIRSKNH